MLIGFAPTNHPQQVGKRGASDKVDERITPAWLFDEWNARFHFTLDAAASADNAKCQTYFTLSCSGLEMPWAGHSVWCNPPFSNCRAWVEKAWREWENDLPARSIVMMLPANRTEQRWWTDLIEPRRDIIGSPLRTTFLARRINFGLPGNPEGKFNSSPPFGVVMLVWSNGFRRTTRVNPSTKLSRFRSTKETRDPYRMTDRRCDAPEPKSLSNAGQPI